MKPKTPLDRAAEFAANTKAVAVVIEIETHPTAIAASATEAEIREVFLSMVSYQSRLAGILKELRVRVLPTSVLSVTT